MLFDKEMNGAETASQFFKFPLKHTNKQEIYKSNLGFKLYRKYL